MRDDRIAIDTNVFQHLFNPEVNTDGHIDKLLAALAKQRRQLCRDRGGRIFSEYRHILEPVLRSKSDDGARLPLLRYFLTQSAVRDALVEVDFGDELMACLRKCMKPSGAEPSDRVFAYVAATAESALVSNDRKHLIENRGRLKDCSRRHAGAELTMLTSKEACAEPGLGG